MAVRELVASDAPSALADVTLRSPRNWTVISFLGALGGLHLLMASLAFAHGQWAGFLSLAFGFIFTLAAIGTALVRSDVTILATERRVRLRTGFRSLAYQRFVAFRQVRLVRLMMPPADSPTSASIEIVCHREVIECPPTSIPRQEALCLAMVLGVRLVKVFGEDSAPDENRIDSLTSN